MKFSKNELNIIYQNAAPTKAETLAGIKETVSVTTDLMTKLIMENAIRRLERIPEPECQRKSTVPDREKQQFYPSAACGGKSTGTDFTGA